MSSSKANDANPLLRVNSLCKDFRSRLGWLGRSHVFRAVDGVRFEIKRGETLALVGESGCGKTTVGRMILGLMRPTSGTVEIHGRRVDDGSSMNRLAITRELQAVFQDPASSLNPRWRIGDIVAEPLVAHRFGGSEEIRRRVESLLEKVGLDASMARRFPHEFSGGQRQRISIARAIAIGPSLIIADEPTSALDVSVRVQILELLSLLQREIHSSYLLITHDLAVVKHYSQRVAVMEAGRIVEQGETTEVLSRPGHPYTQRLLDAVPTLDAKPAR